VETVYEHYGLPFRPFPEQQEAIEDLGELDRIGLYAEPGCGKTLMSTVIALYKKLGDPKAATVVVMPPILLSSWYRWLKRVEGVGKVVLYKGTPKERAGLDLRDADWILVSMQIFKKDFSRLETELKDRPRIGIVDEATSIKNIGSDNHKKVRDFFAGNALMLLTGTPLSNPGDVYAYVKLISPMIYRSQRQFFNIHVEEQDFFGKVTKWRRLDLMKENLLTNSVRLLKEQMLKNLKTPIYVPIFYELDPSHMRLYRKLMEDQLLVLDNGQKIDATSAARLYHAAQQIVTNLDTYSGDPDARAKAYDVLDNTIEELGIDNGSGNKLIVFGQYKQTNRKLVKYLNQYGAVACYSEVAPGQQSKNIDKFTDTKETSVLVAQPLSAGYGLNLQEACHNELFLETPVVPSHFHQAVARIYREGQPNTPVIRIAIAEGTIQQRLYRQLLEKDALVNQVQVGFKDLKEAIYGE